MSTLSVLSRRAYGGRKDQRNVLRSRFPYKKCVFMLRPRGSGIRCRAFVECGRAFPRQPVPMLSPCPRGTIICLRRGRGCVSHQVTYPPGCCRAAHPACGAKEEVDPPHQEDRHLVVLAVVPLEGLLHHLLPMLSCCPLLGPGVSLSARSTVGGWSYVHPLCFEPSRIRRPQRSEERASEPISL